MLMTISNKPPACELKKYLKNGLTDKLVKMNLTHVNNKKNLSKFTIPYTNENLLCKAIGICMIEPTRRLINIYYTIIILYPEHLML